MTAENREVRTESADVMEKDEISFGEMSMEELFGEEQEYTILVPEEMKAEQYTGALYGFYVENTGIFNIVQESIRSMDSRVTLLGEIISAADVQKAAGSAEAFSEKMGGSAEASGGKTLESGEVSGEKMGGSAEASGGKTLESGEVSGEKMGGSMEYKIRKFVERKTSRDIPWITGVWRDGRLRFFVNSNPADTWEDGQEVYRIETYSLKKDIMSRNQGILESDVMQNKTAVFAGCGSGGSFIALELARAGVGRFILCDDDIFGYHNICRHQCGVMDVGKRKVDAMRERILAINPGAEVHTFFSQIQQVNPHALEMLITKDSVLLCCADNRHAGYVCNEMSEKYHIPMIAAGCGARASSGEVFWYKPGCQMPCYTCAYGEDHGVDYAGQAVRRAYYADETELAKADFQPGMGLDIDFVGLFVAKLAIDLLMDAEEGYQPRLKHRIGQCTLLFSYEVDREVNPLMYYFEKPLSWRTGSAEHKKDCPMCAAFAQSARKEKEGAI